MEAPERRSERTIKLEKALSDAHWHGIALCLAVVEIALGAGLIMRGEGTLYWGIGTTIAGFLNMLIYAVWRVRTDAFMNRAKREIALEREAEESSQDSRS